MVTGSGIEVIVMCFAPVIVLFLYAGVFSIFKYIKAQLFRKNEEIDHEL